jgi:hypothetical protein
VDPNQLAAVFQFTAADLAANQAGHIAAGQLGPVTLSLIWGSLLMLAGLGGGLAVRRFGRGALRIVGPVPAVAAAVLIGALVVVPAARDRVSGAVAVIEDEVSEVRIVGKGRGSAVLVIGTARILTRAAPDAARALVERRGRFRIYYLPATDRLLSLEAAQTAPAARND